MKKMKRFVKFLILMMIVLLCSCNETGKPDYDYEMEVNNLSYQGVEFQVTTLAYGKERDEQYLKNWQSYVEESFGIKVNLQFVLDINSGVDMYEYSKRYITKGEKGLYFVESTHYKEFLEFAVSNGLILNVSQYLIENSTWNELPEKYKEIYDEFGASWGLANSSVPVVYGRFLNENWLENLHADKPTDLAELFDLFNRFTFNDPDQNGHNDTFGLVYDNPFDLVDIFNANGCYLDFCGFRQSIRTISPIAYNPSLNEYEDCMLKDDIYSVFEFISELNNNSIIKLNDSGKEAGSYYGREIDSESHVLSDRLLGRNKSPTISYSFADDSLGAYFLTSNINEPEKVINAFVDVFYGSKQGNDIASHGLITEKENIMIPFICEDLNADGSQAKRDLNSLAYYIYPKNQVFLPFDNIITSSIDGSMTNGDTYYRLLDESLNSVMQHNSSIEDIIVSYRIRAKKLGVIELLNELNKK